MATVERRRVEPGIRIDKYGYEAYVKAAGKTISRRFQSDAELPAIRYWRESTRADQLYAAQLSPKGQPPHLSRSLNGWCYIYFVRSRDTIKIGRATNPAARVKELQTSHAHKLELIVAVPAHAALETALHERFAKQRLAGEWFQINNDIVDFIGQLKAGRNPIALLW